MRQQQWRATLLVATTVVSLCLARQNFTTSNLWPDELSTFDDRPDGCPPCFNCNAEGFDCLQFAPCKEASGRCDCQPGFGGEDCSKPLCGSLAQKNRPLKPPRRKWCSCNDGWDGINCNVCQEDMVCKSFTPEPQGAVCYKGGLPQKEVHHMCNVTNPGIVKQLKDEIPQATLSCNAQRKDCNFQCMFPLLPSYVLSQV